MSVVHTPVQATQATDLKQALHALQPYFLRAAGWSFVTALLSLMPSVYMFQVYDRVVNSRNLSTLLMLSVLMVLVYVVLVLMDTVIEELLRRAGRLLEQLLAVRVFDSIFAAQRDHEQAGAEPQSDLRTLREFVSSPALQALLELPGAFVFLFCIFWISKPLGFAALVGAVVQALIAYWTERSTQPLMMQANHASMGATAYARGALQSTQVIESMGMFAGVHERWSRQQRRFLALQAKASDHAGLTGALAKTVQIIQGSALLGLGCWFYLRGQLEDGGGMMIVISILGGKVLQPLVKIIGQWKTLVQARQARDRLGAFLSKFPPRVPQMPLPAPTGRLSVEGLTVAVPGQDAAQRLPLLRNVTLQIPAGTVMAVIGPSGAGKTSLARALLGLLPSVSGKVRLDEMDVQTRDKELLGEHLGYLPQDVALFDGTLAQNVTRFGTEDPERLAAACRQAGLDELIANLPEGVQTMIGPGGEFLSGGQRQRVGLARAIYGSPALVILDEPYSNLDNAGEKVVLDIVRTLKQRAATVILITHLPSMLAVADTVLLLVDGSVQLVGPRDEVLAALEKSRQAQGGDSPAAAANRSAA